MMSVAGLMRDDFAVHVGSVFTLVGAEGTTMPLTLVEAELGRSPAFQDRVPFALLFRSEVQQVVPQGIYRFEHPVMGELEIFIAPVARTATGIDYEAVFN